MAPPSPANLPSLQDAGFPWRVELRNTFLHCAEPDQGCGDDGESEQPSLLRASTVPVSTLRTELLEAEANGLQPGMIMPPLTPHVLASEGIQPALTRVITDEIYNYASAWGYDEALALGQTLSIDTRRQPEPLDIEEDDVHSDDDRVPTMTLPAFVCGTSLQSRHAAGNHLMAKLSKVYPYSPASGAVTPLTTPGSTTAPLTTPGSTASLSLMTPQSTRSGTAKAMLSPAKPQQQQGAPIPASKSPRAPRGNAVTTTERKQPSQKQKNAGGNNPLEVLVEKRTTVMMRNLPNNYTRDALTDLIDSEGFAGRYNFLYFPIDFRTHAALGYAFLNLVTPEDAEVFRQRLDGFSRWLLPSSKICSVGWSHPHQGLDSHIARYRNSPLMHEAVPDGYRPALFQGGVRIPFPPPTKKIKPPRQGTERMLV